MRAIDTNIIARFLTGDDPVQSAKAKAVLEAGEVFVSVTVMLETAWVLGRVYRYSPKDMVAALRAFAGLPNVRMEASAMVAEALDRTEAGMDFADAMHLGEAIGCEAFVTFDRKFIAAAKDKTAVPVIEP